MALSVKRAERLVEVCLDGPLLAEWEAVDREYKAARAEQRASRDKRMNDPLAKRVDELMDKARELSAAAREQSVTFRVRALPRVEWDLLVTKHPARKEDKDRGLPFNVQGITDAALSTEGAIVSVTHPDGTDEPFTHADWEAFSADLSSSQHDDFQAAVVNLNAGANEVPFLPASAPTTDSDES